MSTATRDNTNNVWKVDVDLGTITNANVTKTAKLATAGTYVDEDIWVSATASKPSAAALGASATGSAEITSATVGTKSNGNYPITGSADISGTASASTTTSGYATAGTTKASGSTTGTATLNASIPAGALNASGTASATITSATIGTKSGTTYPITGSASISGTASASVKTAGYVKNETGSGNVTGTATLNATIPAGALGISDSSAPTGYTKATKTVPSDGSLTLSAGYYPATYITLADLVPDEATLTESTGAPYIRQDETAYDKNGKLIVGTMGDATFSNSESAGSATITGPTYNSTNDNFSLSSSGTASHTITAATAGFIDAGTVVDEHTQTVSGSKTLAKVALSTTKTSGNLTVAPTLTRTAKPSGDAWVDAASGAATTTKPTTADPYVQIDAAAATNTLKIKPTVSTAGYGDTSHYGYTEYSGTVGAAKATTRYIPITKGTATANSVTVTVTGGTPTLNNTTNKYDIALSGSGSTTATVSKAGWIESIGSSTATASGTVSLNKAALTHGTTATETKASATLKATATNNVNTATSGSYYITVGQDAVTAGSVTHDASVSEGYVPTDGLSTSAKIPTSATVTSKTFYLSSTNITGSVSGSTISPTGTGAITYGAPDLKTTAPTAPYIDLTGNGSATAKSVYTGTATAAHKYMSVYTGTYTVS